MKHPLHPSVSLSLGRSTMIGTLLLILAATIFVKVFLHYSHWARHGVPYSITPSFAWFYTPVTTYLFENRIKEHKIVGVFRPFRRILVVNNARVAKELSIKEAHKFPIRMNIHLGAGIIKKLLFFMQLDNDWKRIRNIITPAFTSGKLKTMMEPIEQIIGVFISHLRRHAQSGVEFDVKPYLDGFTMDIIARCGYGIQLDSIDQPNHPIILNGKRILNVDVGIRQFLCVSFPWLARKLKLELFDVDAVKYFDDLTKTIVERRKQTGQTNHSDLIGLMMKELDSSGGSKISLEEISAQGVLFFIAGFDTTNAAFDHILYYMAKHPEWQDQLYEELKNNELTYEKLCVLPILNAIINETLRLAPSLTLFGRTAIEDCTLLDTGIPIPKGTTISIQPFLIHRDPDYFENPEQFMPERFIGTNLDSSDAFMPFGIGARFCVGMRFAQNELRMGVSKFFLNFKVSIPNNFELEYFNGSLLMSPKALRIVLKERPLA